MYNRKIGKVPGKTALSPREKQGYIDDLSLKTKYELIELIERQNKLLANRSCITKLPDKGSRITAFREKLKEELQRRDEIDSACKILSGLNISSNGSINDKIEWTGKINGKEVTESNHGDSDEDIDPLKLIASHSGVNTAKKSRRVEDPEEPLITSEDLQEITSCKSETCSILSVEADNFVAKRCEKISISTNKKEPFRPFRTTKSDVHSVDNLKKSIKGTKWEVTAATPPVPVYGETKLVAIEESLKLQKEQIEKLKEVQAKHAAEKLNRHFNLKIGNTLPDVSLRGSYRDPERSNSLSSSDNEDLQKELSEVDECDDEHERDTAVIYSIVDD